MSPGKARIAAIVLAAGGSRRLGHPKALVRIEGRTLVERAWRAAREGGCSPVLVVVGCDADALLVRLRGRPVEAVVNPGWREGMASSIRAGIRALERRWPEVGAALLLACDQPRLEGRVVRRLLARAGRAPSAIVASRYAGRDGIPVLFPRERFPELARLRGERGARSLLRRHPGSVARVAWPGGAEDLDRLSDLDRLRGAGPGAPLLPAL